MTKREAIDVLRANYPDPCFEDLREAVGLAIESLRGDVPDTNGGDTISRQTAIDAADNIIERDTSGNNDVVKAMTA